MYNCFNSADAERSIILYFQTEEGGAAKKKLKALVFLYYNSFISYAYLV